jgi:SAM-dependent methyltransferase
VTIPCLLCQGETALTQDEVRDNRFGVPGTWRIRRCASCGLEQTEPLPTQAELKSLYEAHYNYGGESGTTYTGSRERILLSPLYRLWLKLDGDISFHDEKGSGRLLDVGCNEGRGLMLYRANGFSPEGLELNARAAEVARSRGFMVHEVDISAFKPSLPFDRVVLSNVLEHALDPRAMLSAIKRVLVPGGEVWISLPNRDSWLRRLFGRHWINWHVPFHITHFDEKRLASLLKEEGFEVTQTKNVTPALWVALSLVASVFANPKMQRKAPLVAMLMLIARFGVFPVLWLGNRLGSGDCLVVKARRL